MFLFIVGGSLLGAYVAVEVKNNWGTIIKFIKKLWSKKKNR